MLAYLRKFFAATDGSIKGFVNPEELFRSILTSMGSATTIGVVMVVIQAVLTNIGTIIPDPTVAALVTGLLTLVLDLLRRQNQGTKPTPGTAILPTPAVL